MRMRYLSSFCIVFAVASIAIAGRAADSAWETLSPDEKQKLLTEYKAYLYPAKDGKAHPKFKEAKEIMGRRDLECAYVLPAIFAWSDIDKNPNPKKLTPIGVCRAELIGLVIARDVLTRQPKFVEKLPDRMIDEYLWTVKRNGDITRALERIGDFGPRASRVYEDIRSWFKETNGGTGANQVTAGTVKQTLDRIQKK
jgi:hypothetical protein